MGSRGELPGNFLEFEMPSVWRRNGPWPGFQIAVADPSSTISNGIARASC
jgi:hypothetical protein